MVRRANGVHVLIVVVVVVIWCSWPSYLIDTCTCTTLVVSTTIQCLCIASSGVRAKAIHGSAEKEDLTRSHAHTMERLIEETQDPTSCANVSQVR
jgi:hypothetical protein